MPSGVPKSAKPRALTASRRGRSRPSPADDHPTFGAFQRGPQNAVFSSSMEACSCDLSDTGEGPGTTPFILARKSSRHDWQGF
jgi:hypothetical protein